jgi:hypothetical protein
LKLAWRLLICLSIFVVLADIVFASLYNVILINIPHNFILALYIFLSLGFVVIFWGILILARITPIEVKGSFMRISQISTWLLQTILSIFVIVLLLEVLYNAEYTQAVSSYAQFSGFLGGIFLLTILLRQLIYSFKRFRSTIIFLYSLSIVSTLSYLVILLGLTYLVVPDKPVTITQSWLMTHVYLPTDSIEWWLSKIVPYFQDASFLILWFASGYLFRYHFKKRRSVVFIVLLLTPAIYFLGRIVDISYLTGYLITLIGGTNVTESVIRIVIRTVSPLIGGIIFGLSFYYSSRSLPTDSKLRTYLNITGHGLIILLVSSQYGVIFQYPYPPFGTIALSSTYLGAYLILVGIYSTAVSSAQNLKIHNEISRIIQERSKLSHEMGTAIFIESIEKQISKLEKGIETESGIESVPDEKEIRKYIEEVLSEKRKHTRN